VAVFNIFSGVEFVGLIDIRHIQMEDAVGAGVADYFNGQINGTGNNRQAQKRLVPVKQTDASRSTNSYMFGNAHAPVLMLRANQHLARSQQFVYYWGGTSRLPNRACKPDATVEDIASFHRPANSEHLYYSRTEMSASMDRENVPEEARANNFKFIKRFLQMLDRGRCFFIGMPDLSGNGVSVNSYCFPAVPSPCINVHTGIKTEFTYLAEKSSANFAS